MGGTYRHGVSDEEIAAASQKARAGDNFTRQQRDYWQEQAMRYERLRDEAKARSETLERDLKLAQWALLGGDDPSENEIALTRIEALEADLERARHDADNVAVWTRAEDQLKRIEELEKEKADLAIGYAEYKRLYEAGCKAWNPVYKKTLDRVEELKKERDEWRTKAGMADGLSVLADAGIDGHAAAITVVKKYAAHIEELKKLLAEASDRIEGLDGEAKAKGRVVVELSLALLNARRKALEEAELIALTQRCERDTAWDNACVTIAAAIRALKEKE